MQIELTLIRRPRSLIQEGDIIPPPQVFTVNGQQGDVVLGPTNVGADPVGAADAVEEHLTIHKNRTDNPHNVTKSQMGLSLVDNTSDVNKPISNATQSALALKAPLSSPIFTDNPVAPTPVLGDNTTRLATTAFVAGAIGALVGSAPGVLNTLQEIADALGDDPNFATTVTTLLAQKVTLDDPRLSDARTPVAHTHVINEVTELTFALAAKATVVSLNTHVVDTNNPHSVTAAQVGLGNVLNTTQEPAILNGGITQFWRGDKTWQSITNTTVGLSNVTNDAQVKRSEMGAVSGVATLDGAGKIPTAQLPNLTVSENLGIVGSQSAMLALLGQAGDFCIRSDDGNHTYVLYGNDPTVAGNWIKQFTTTDVPVQNVFGRTGNVVLLASDVSGVGGQLTGGVLALGGFSSISGSLPIGNISGLGMGVSTLLSSASTGTGGLVGKISPSLVTPDIGAATGTSLMMIGNGQALAISNSGTTATYQYFTNSGGRFYQGVDNSAGTGLWTGGLAYASSFGTGNATALQLATNNNVRFTIASGGDITQTGSLTVSGGTITGGSSGLSLAAGGTNQNITLTPSAAGMVVIPTGGIISGSSTGNGTGSFDGVTFYAHSSGSSNIRAGLRGNAGVTPGLVMIQTGGVTWQGSPTSLNETDRTGIFENAAGVVEINNGTAIGATISNARDLTLRTLYGPNPSGTNIAGGDLTLSGGLPTGNAAGGGILFAVSNAAGASGTTQNTKQTVGKLFPSGGLYLGTGTAIDPGVDNLQVKGWIKSTNDVEITDSAKGVIVKSPNGTRWRVTVDDSGTLIRTAL